MYVSESSKTFDSNALNTITMKTTQFFNVFKTSKIKYCDFARAKRGYDRNKNHITRLGDSLARPWLKNLAPDTTNN